MNIRICTVVAAALLLSLSTGCSGMRNFMFGRGARCGLCNKISNVTPRFGNTMQAPYKNPAPCGAPNYAPAPKWQAPTCLGPRDNASPNPSAGCGCNGCAGNNANSGIYDAGVYAGNCGSCGAMYDGGCGCGGVGGYTPAVSDPYLNSGEIVGEQVIGGQSYPANPTPGYPAPAVPSDNFRARKFDTDGNRILWEEPLPQSNGSI